MPFEAFEVLASPVGIDTNLPMSPGAVVVGIGVLITWVMFAIALWNVRNTMRRNDIETRKSMEEIADSRCEHWHNRAEQVASFERKVNRLIQADIDAEFRQRSSSFVDSKEFHRAESEILRRVDTLERSVAEVGAKIERLGATVSSEVSIAVTRQLAAFLGSTAKQQPRE